MTAKLRPIRLRRALPVLLLVLAGRASFGARPISELDFGLAKGSVFDNPASAPFRFEDEAKLAPPAPGSGIPPMITHAIDEFLPLTLAKNECADCHDKPHNIGKPVPRGKGLPAPLTHYVRNADGKPKLMGTQYNCVSCHAPQAGVQPLVRNTAG